MGLVDVAVPITVTGRVKWFDPIKGYGFIEQDRNGKDVLLHQTCVKLSGYRIVSDGARITCEVHDGPQGLRAVKVLSLENGVVEVTPQSETKQPHNVPAPTGNWFIATVKWFDRRKGYGFMTSGKGSPDIFMHMEVVRQSGIRELRQDQRFRIRTGMGPRGIVVADMAAEK
jgi:CspA family cold shock protein